MPISIGPNDTEVVVVTQPSATEVAVVNVPGLRGEKGDPGEQGIPGDPNVLTIGAVNTGAPGSNASATISGVSPSQTLNFTIPRGDVGATGPANTLTPGTINTGAPGSSVVATITGTAPNQILNLTIPRGDVGASNVLSIGTVTNATPGATGTVTITGTSPTQTLNFTLPVVAHMGTSATSFLIGTGSKVFVTQAGLAFQIGDFVRIASRANGANYMAGNVTAYSGTSLTVNVTETGGSGTFTDWNINTSGVKGNTGGTGAASVISSTSTTSLVIGTGSKVFTTAVALNLVVGQTVKAYQTTTPANYMIGLITAIAGTSLTMNATEIGGTGTINAWTIALSGFSGVGVPAGGNTDAVLTKNSAADYDDKWTDATASATGNTIVKRDSNGQITGTRVFSTSTPPTTAGELTRKDYVDTQLDSRTRKVTFDPGSPGASGRQYIRLATLDGESEFRGSNINFILSGTGDFGGANRGTIIVHFAQRGIDGIGVKAFGFGVEDTLDPIEFYTKQISTYKFELWVKLSDWNLNHDIHVLSSSDPVGSTYIAINVDAGTTAPTGLSASPYPITHITQVAGTVNAATNAATASQLVKRDASGDASFNQVGIAAATPTSAAQATRKDYVDAQVATKANSTHSHAATDISNSTATGRSVLTAADATAARTAIGAGTSNLAIGTTSTTAKAGDYTPPDASSGTKGLIQLAGHLTGTAAVPNVRTANETQTGVVELATAAETTAGTDNTRAVHPAGLKVELDKLNTAIGNVDDDVILVEDRVLAIENTRLGGLTLVKTTQAAYDALGTKDANTIYVIVG